jgi:hypothetical protein
MTLCVAGILRDTVRQNANTKADFQIVPLIPDFKVEVLRTYRPLCSYGATEYLCERARWRAPSGPAGVVRDFQGGYL